MLHQVLSSRITQSLYAAVLSVRKDLKAKDGRTYHVLEITDSEDIALLYLWSDECPFARKDYIYFAADIVIGKKFFFSCAFKDINKISFDAIPQNSIVRNVKFSFGVDFYVLSKEIREFVDCKVTDPNFVKLLYEITSPEFLEIISKAPAAASVHHVLEGGLLKHISEMFDIYSHLSDSFVFQNLRHEFVLIGIILHDYFKYAEYVQTDSGFSVTKNSVLLGHIFQGAAFLQNLFDRLQTDMSSPCSFTQEDIEKSIHVLLAHHGKKEWGSPVVPSIKEAVVLHYIDQLSAKMNMFDTSPEMEFNKYLETSVIK